MAARERSSGEVPVRGFLGPGEIVALAVASIAAFFAVAILMVVLFKYAGEVVG